MTSERPRAVFYTGLALYVISFFLPAVADNTGGLPGWFCAWFAFAALHGVNQVSPVAIFGGLINPVAVVYVVLRILGRARRLRIASAIAILIFIPLTWLSLIFMQLGVRIGHVLWIAGLLLMISWKDLGSSPAKADPDTPKTTFVSAVKKVSQWAVASAVIVLAGYGLDRAFTKPLLPPTDRDFFFFDVAVQFPAPDVCSKINPYALGSEAAFSTPGYQVSYLQSECYYDLAGVSGDLSLCEKVLTAHERGLDGSKYSPTGCKHQQNPYAGPRFGAKDAAFEQIMRDLGYSRKSYEDYRSMYKQILYQSDANTRADFLRRVMEMK